LLVVTFRLTWPIKGRALARPGPMDGYDANGATNMGKRRKWLRIWADVLLARGLRIRVKTIGGFLHSIRQGRIVSFIVPFIFCEYCTHL